MALRNGSRGRHRWLAGYPSFMILDVERARRDTPGTSRVAHLNNAGAALPPVQVTEAVVAHLRREAELGRYEAAVSHRTHASRFSPITEIIAHPGGARTPRCCSRYGRGLRTCLQAGARRRLGAFPMQSGSRCSNAKGLCVQCGKRGGEIDHIDRDSSDSPT